MRLVHPSKTLENEGGAKYISFSMMVVFQPYTGSKINKPSKNELSFVLACKVEILEPNKIKMGVATF
jgi:hypothetical protein